MKTILVTGGAGFIGSNFVKYMLEKYPDYNIVNIDSFCMDNISVFVKNDKKVNNVLVSFEFCKRLN